MFRWPDAAQPFWVVAVLLLSTAPLPLVAQQAPRDTTPVVLQTLEVTATRPVVPPPTELTIDVTGAVVQRQQSANAYDLVRRAAGIEVHDQGQGPGWASDVVIRGFTSDHSSDVLFVIDGVPVNLPIHGHVEGYSDWSILSPAAVRGLRVIHGPVSPLYGNFAFGGVVEVSTAPDASGTAATIGGSSYGDTGGWLRSGRRADRGGFLVAVDGRRATGWRDNSGSWYGNGSVRGWRQLGDSSRLEGGLTLYAADWDSPGFLSVSQYNAGQLKTAADRTDGGSGGRVILQGSYSRRVGGSGQFALLGWSQVARSTSFLTISDDGVVNQQEEGDHRSAVGATASYRLSVGDTGGEHTVGAAGRADWDQYDLYRTRQRSRVLTRQLNAGRYQEANLFLRYRGFLGSRILYDLGARGDLLRPESRDREVAGSGFVEDTKTTFSPKIGTRVLLSGSTSIVGSLSRGFRSAIGTIRNPSRPLVSAWATEVGIAYQGTTLEGQLALFQTDVSNERILDPVSLLESDAGQSRRRGISADLSIRLTPQLRLSAEGTLNDPRITGVTPSDTGAIIAPVIAAVLDVPHPSFHDVPLTPGAQIPGVARYVGRVGVELISSDRLESRVQVRFSGPFTPIGEPSVRTRPYAIADLGASVRLGGFGTLDLDLQNIINSKYPEIRASGYINPGAPRTLRAALRLPVTPS
jgi:hypothetical protein